MTIRDVLLGKRKQKIVLHVSSAFKNVVDELAKAEKTGTSTYIICVMLDHMEEIGVFKGKKYRKPKVSRG